jgi:hypothetical protein
MGMEPLLSPGVVFSSSETAFVLDGHFILYPQRSGSDWLVKPPRASTAKADMGHRAYLGISLLLYLRTTPYIRYCTVVAQLAVCTRMIMMVVTKREVMASEYTVLSPCWSGPPIQGYRRLHRRRLPFFVGDIA